MLFDMNLPFWQFLAKIADLLVLNMLFIISCIPIVTIGPALIAMNYVTLKMAEGREGTMTGGFIRAFRENFKQGVIAGLLFMAAAAVIGVLIYTNGSGRPGSSPVLGGLGLGLAFFFVIFLNYVFRYMARFEDTIVRSVGNSLIMATHHLYRTLLMMALTIAAVILTVSFLPLILCICALVSYINSLIMRGVFAKYMPSENDETAV